jgi:hypothetical protein
MINQTQIQMAETLAERFSRIPGVLSAKVDDWSDYGYFSLFVEMKGHWTGGYNSYFIPEGEDLSMDRIGRKNRRRVRVLGMNIRSILNTAKKADEIFSFDSVYGPEGIYHKVMGYTKFDGYNSSSFKVNVRIPEDFPIEKTIESEKKELA